MRRMRERMRMRRSEKGEKNEKRRQKPHWVTKQKQPQDFSEVCPSRSHIECVCSEQRKKDGG
jgi:hypothetical protein